jgi:hypothetical protein
MVNPCLRAARESLGVHPHKARSMRHLLKSSIAALALISATPAMADIVDARASDSQGTLVHGNGGAADVGTDVTGTLGAGPSAPEIVHFTGDTTAAGDENDVMLQQGAGQAELSGATISGNTTEGLISGDIFLTDNAGMEWIELAFFGLTGTSIDFSLSGLAADGVTPEEFAFNFLLDGSGSARYAFDAINGEVITNLAYTINGGSADGLRQVRIASSTSGVPPVPEPATWAMMLMGFGAAGYAMRRRRQQGGISQIA